MSDKKEKGKSLVIVESPAKAKTINKFIGNQYKVKASMGHIRDLPEKELGINVDREFEPKYVVLSGRKKLVGELKQLAKNADAIYLAPDPDREGEAIAWHLASILNVDNEKIKRVTFNEITRTAVQKAFVKPGKIDMQKVNSQQARRILDRIVGYKISPFLWKKVGKGLSAGRVQSVAVRLICDREEEVLAFVPEEYWSIKVLLSKLEGKKDSFIAMLDSVDGKKVKPGNSEDANKIASSLQEVSYQVKQVKKKEKKQKASPPFITSRLQQSAVNRLRFSVQKTMWIAQQLYEGVELGDKGPMGLITYMRTDSFRIASEAEKEVRSYIEKKYGKEYLPPAPNRYRSKKGSQGAHEAIRPTSMELTPEAIRSYLNDEQFRLYQMIWNRFVACQMNPARFEETQVQISAGSYGLRASGTRMLFDGYYIAEAPPTVQKEEEKDDDAPSKTLPLLQEGEKLQKNDVIPKQHFTKPPPRYNEASLVRMLEEKNIGRPSTYAPIIQTILRREYVVKNEGKLTPSLLGKTVTKLLVENFPDILDITFTAKMEGELDGIEEGNAEWKKMIAGFYSGFMIDLVKATRTVSTVKNVPTMTDEICPECNSPMVLRVGRYGKFLACSTFPKCKGTKPIDTGVSCPEEKCDGVLVERRSKKGKTFYGCSSYPKCKFTSASLKNLNKSSEKTDNGKEDDTVS
ncbi:MAG: type I DNA topoisomerase [Candidatus Theseobacter exili]|nr:type I DNA topoisomerase [Candidatus Theseobacter exili]